MTTTVVQYVTATLDYGPAYSPPAPSPNAGTYNYPQHRHRHPGEHQDKGNVPTDKNNYGYRGNPSDPRNPNYGKSHQDKQKQKALGHHDKHTKEKPKPQSKTTSKHTTHKHTVAPKPTHKTSTSSRPQTTPSSPSLYGQSSHTPSSSPSSDSGMSGGTKAGIAIGLIVIIAAIAGLVLLFYRKKKNDNEGHQQLDDEKSGLNQNKSGFNSQHVSVRRTVQNAPRLSLRPVTEMFPSMAEKQDSNASSASTLIANSAASARAKSPQGFNSPNSADDRLNPFGDHAEANNNVQSPAAAVPKPLSVKSERTGTGLSESAMPTNQTAGAAPPASGNTRRMSPPGPGPNNVHRVQLDFNPSMDDELGLRAGQLVRMLHEYDDGWALCIRLDRSQQGVVPRTCLSKLPVKPRPQGPPQGPPPGGMRGPPPQPRARGPSNGLPPRMPPAGAQGNGRVRAQSNGPRQGRPESPGPMAPRMGGPPPRARSNSDAMSARRITPPGMAAPLNPNSTSPTQGPGMPSRKPVPGQAM